MYVYLRGAMLTTLNCYTFSVEELANAATLILHNDHETRMYPRLFSV